MLDVNEIRRAIAELESRDVTFSTCAKLANLYAVVDHHDGASSYDRGYSETPKATNTLDSYGESDFLHAVAGKDASAVLDIIDELMDTLQLVNKRAYSSVMRKIETI